MSTTYDCREPEARADGLRRAVQALKRGSLVVLPTDTVYGIAADAFSPVAVGSLLAAKGRGRDMPVPILVGSPRTVEGVATGLTQEHRDLMTAFWPGALTIVLRQQPTLSWDLGETGGTVAVRMPLHPVAIEVLRETGPLGVSSANRTGQPPATSVAEAEEQLGSEVAIYLDGGRCADAVPSTIVDLTGPTPRLLREGALAREELLRVLPGLEP